MKISFELVAPDGQEFVCHAADGSEIRVEAGKIFSSSELDVIRELDAQPHAVRRTKSKGEES